MDEYHAIRAANRPLTMQELRDLAAQAEPVTVPDDFWDDVSEDQPGYVYRLHGRRGHLGLSTRRPLYIGSTLDPWERPLKHRRKAWWPGVDRISLVRYSTRQAAFNAEWYAIRTENPIHNKAGRPPSGLVRIEFAALKLAIRAAQRWPVLSPLPKGAFALARRVHRARGTPRG